MEIEDNLVAGINENEIPEQFSREFGNLRKSRVLEICRFKPVQYKLKILIINPARPMQSVKNYYDILQIPQSASSIDIEHAYQKLSAFWHPDKHRDNRRNA